MDRLLKPKNCRKTSTVLLAQNPVKDLGVKDCDVGKILFLSVDPEHVSHDDQTSLDPSSCSLCRLCEKFKDVIRTKSFGSLKRELRVKTMKLSQRDVAPPIEVFTLESNFSDDDDKLDKDDQELLTFTETLDLMKIPLPEILAEKVQIVLAKKKIPARQNRSGSEKAKINAFLAYTVNKKLSDICSTLSPEEVYALKEFALRQKENDDAIIKMAESLSEIDDPEALKSIPGFKDVVFYYIIMTMFRVSLLNRLYTHLLQYLLKGARDSLPAPETRQHIQTAVNTLDCYLLTKQPPGLCIILAMMHDRNQEQERTGALKDVKEIRKTFETDLNYDVFVKINPTRENIKQLLMKIKATRNMFYDSLVVWFMGHGNKTYLEVQGGEIHRRDELITPFTEIEWLRKKPKLFFIQACATKRPRSLIAQDSDGPTRGLKTKRDSIGLGINASLDWQMKYGRHTDAEIVNTLADTLVSYATMWYQPASHNEDGSLFITTLLDCLKQKGHQESIEDVLRQVHYRVNTVMLNCDDEVWKQTPYYESSLQKRFIFPTIVGDEQTEGAPEEEA